MVRIVKTAKTWQFDHAKLNELMEAAEITNVAMGSLMGRVSRKAVAHWREGLQTPPLRRVLQACDILGVKPQALFVLR